ncbi:MAG: hypothetical protein CM15mP83_8900 [Flavobacteriaceae bacterium]|nr:MAG: hypothetical protein CM15mP83_8900 [Flavobacteriaceae bacterium]
MPLAQTHHGSVEQVFSLLKPKTTCVGGKTVVNNSLYACFLTLINFINIQLFLTVKSATKSMGGSLFIFFFLLILMTKLIFLCNMIIVTCVCVFIDLFFFFVSVLCKRKMFSQVLFWG